VDTVLRVIGFLSIPVLILSVVMMIRGLHRVRVITVRSLVLPAAISIVLLLVYVNLLGITPPTGWSWALMSLGLLIGIIQSRTTKMHARNGSVFGKRSICFLVTWAIAFTLTQLLALFGRGNIASYGLLAIYLATGLSIGMNLSLLFRRQRTLSGANTGAFAFPDCGREIAAGTRFCTGCGKEVAPVTAQPSITCPDCGSVNRPGQRFCTECGRPLAE